MSNVTYVTAEQFAALQAQLTMSGDTAWLLTSSAFVMFMTPGLAFFYGGLVHRKNVINTIQMSFAALSTITILWFVCGYSFAFGPGDGFLGDGTFAVLRKVGTEPNPAYISTVPHLVFMIYQLMFAIITPALISGAVVERMSFRAYMIFIVLWSILVYDVVAHWSWSAWYDTDGVTMKVGWLREFGVLDFAGGNVVHIISGSAALVVAWFVGPRHGYPAETAPAHNLPMVVLGTSILWFGWFGFNAGSALQANGLAAIAFCNTHIATAAAFLTWLILESLVSRPSLAGACTGAVVGLVTITPGAGFVPIYSSIIFGIVGSMATFTVIYIKHKFVGADSRMGRIATSIDDSLDAFSCHGVGGLMGAILTGLFASLDVNPYGHNGAFYGNPKQLGIQIVSALVCAGWSVLVSAVLMIILKYTVGIRVPLQGESEGLDAAEHGEIAYHLVNRDLLLGITPKKNDDHMNADDAGHQHHTNSREPKHT